MVPPKTYFDLDPHDPPPEKCAFAILPLAYDATASYVKGAAKAPEAILRASVHVEDYDEELGFCPERAGIATLEGPDLEGLEPAEAAEAVYLAAREGALSGRRLIAVGGDHSVTGPLVRALQETEGDFDVVQIDAHTDLRGEYQGSSYSHACAMARVRDLGVRVTQVGVRATGSEELEALADEGVRTFWMHELRGRSPEDWITHVLASVGPKVYMTFDFDVLDPSIMPATGCPEPGGFDWATILELLEALAREREIVGSDFVELCPIAGLHHADFLAARLIYRWIGYLGKFKI